MFKCKDTDALYHGKFVKRFGGNARQALKRLRMLDAAETLEALLGLASKRLESLKGDRKGQDSIRINDHWRICFQWNNGAEEVEIVDYH